jgi:aminopeptidase YwaD
MRKLIFLLFIVTASQNLFAQNRKYAQYIIDTLSSAEFHGRGYVFNGDIKSAEFIKTEMINAGLAPFVTDYFHPFTLNVNTFPSEMDMQVDSEDKSNLVPGVDFVVNPSSNSLHGTYATHYISGEDLQNNRTFRMLKRSKCKGKVLVLDTMDKKDKDLQHRKSLVLKNFKGKAVIEITDDLTWSVGRRPLNYGAVKLKTGMLDIAELKAQPQNITFGIQNEYIESYKAKNVCGIIKGAVRPDSFVFFTAHYDHLGRMGEDTYIPGANDNASGVAMMLDMAKYFSENPPKYSLVFIGFAAEEAGLVGSYNFVKELRSFVDPTKIRFVINMDLMGSGEKGIMAVNGKIFEEEFDILEQINSDKGYLPLVKKRGKAANSDHYFFSESGIPAFFFYLMGEYHFYHEVEDSAENLRLGKYYDRSFLLIRDFLEALQN